MTASADIEAIAARRPRRGRRLLWWLGLVVALGLAALALGQSFGAEPAVRYVTEPAARADVAVTVSATGTLQPTNRVEISSELSGTVKDVAVDFNDLVTAGQTLATLETDVLESSLALARASLSAAQAQLAEAQATLEERRAAFARADRLRTGGLATAETFSGVDAALKRAEAQLAGREADLSIQRANVALKETDLGKAVLTSPVTGVVLDRKVEPGQIVAASFSAPILFTLAEDLTRMDLLVDIDEADIGKVAVGNTATFTVEAFIDETFPATIAQVRYASETVNGVVTYKARLAIKNAELKLRPGMTAVADITVADFQDALTVANAALRYAPPVAVAAEGGAERPPGLLGLFARDDEAEAPAPPPPAADGRRTVHVLRGGVPVPVQVRTGASDGARTVIEEGEVVEGDLVVTAEEGAP